MGQSSCSTRAGQEARIMVNVVYDDDDDDDEDDEWQEHDNGDVMVMMMAVIMMLMIRGRISKDGNYDKYEDNHEVEDEDEL